MSRTPVVTGWRGASFGGVDFAKYVTSWEDTRDRVGTVHEYIKRDGGEGEDAGRKSFLSVVHLAFIGATWRADYLKLQNVIDDNPIQTLTHPVHGSMTAYCRNMSGRMDVENAPNFYEVTLRFEESSVDTSKAVDSDITQQGPTAKQQNVTNAVTAMLTAAAPFLSAAAAVSTLATTATAYAAAAVASAQAMTPDPTLARQLASAQIAMTAALVAISADPLAAPGYSDPAAFAIELVYDTCTQMDDSVRALRPQLALVTIPMTMHITAWSLYYYGPIDGPTREAEILTNNPQIVDPGFIPAGTQLLMAPATVVR